MKWWKQTQNFFAFFFCLLYRYFVCVKLKTAPISTFWLIFLYLIFLWKKRILSCKWPKQNGFCFIKTLISHKLCFDLWLCQWQHNSRCLPVNDRRIYKRKWSLYWMTVDFHLSIPVIMIVYSIRYMGTLRYYFSLVFFFYTLISVALYCCVASLGVTMLFLSSEFYPYPGPKYKFYPYPKNFN